ncbi:hypothetical protein KUCAC02_029072, partial [Chaenocephalus aceratus]
SLTVLHVDRRVRSTDAGSDRELLAQLKVSTQEVSQRGKHETRDPRRVKHQYPVWFFTVDGSIHRWSTGGAQVEHRWSTHGVPVEYTWSTDGVHMEYRWSTGGVHMEYTWSTGGVQVDYTWSTCGVHMEYRWSTGGVHMEY